ncbi:hypothetical protein ACFC1W_07975 [Microbacterium sp. NPDC056003]|uniref:hypothetical protein n=1 Tax=Microbacterium sp. NPDC056003 TaxID=3345676 RepID=UPI0035DF0F23
MDVWIWVVLAGLAALAAGGVWWKRRARRVYVIDHVRVEMHPACVVEDRVIEQVWRAAISMTNTSRRPRELPVFGERAEVRAWNRVHLATVYLESDAVEANPGVVALAWVEFVLQGGERPRQVDVALLSRQRPMTLRFTSRRESLNGLLRARFGRASSEVAASDHRLDSTEIASMGSAVHRADAIARSHSERTTAPSDQLPWSAGDDLREAS